MLLDDLCDVEAIRQLKARYCLLLDAQRWDDLRALFTDEADFSVGSGEYSSPDEFIASIRTGLAGELHAHVAHMPIIEKTGRDSAHGLWIFSNRGAIGHYQDRYRREGGVWRIAHTTMTWIVPPSEDLLRIRKGQFAAVAPQWQTIADRWGAAAKDEDQEDRTDVG